MLFLQYILKQDKESMMFRILKAIEENPVKNDFVFTCKKYLEILKMNTTFEQLEKLSKIQLKKIIKERIQHEALVYLKIQQMKQEKIKNINYNQLKMQDYLAEGDRNILVSKIIYRARGMTLDLKMQKKWKYEDILCEGCHENEETGEEVLRCEKLGSNVQQVDYTWFYSELVTKKILVGKVLVQKLKKRKQLREGVT